MEANWDDPEYLRARARRKTIWIVGFILHVALFALLIGWPYVRGEMRGRDSRRAFGVFAACFYGGEVTGEAGLSLPAGDRLAYANHYLSAEDDWPGRCRPLLGELIDGEPFLLYPGVKGAEARVRAVAEIADAELVALEEARSEGDGGGRIPVEPLAAVGAVAGSLADLAREIDPRTPIEDEVITLSEIGLPDPARVPLTTASDAVIFVRALGDGIRVHAVDARGLSRTQSLGGRSRAGRIRRPGTVRAMLDGEEDPILVHATNPELCPEDPHRCARRSTGLSRWIFGEGATEAIWLSGHPRGRIDRSLSVSARDVWMVAVGADGDGAELRWFALPKETDPDAAGESDADPETVEREATPAMLAADRSIVLEGVTADDDVLLAGDRALYSVTDESGESRFFLRRGESEPVLLAELAGGGPYIAACEDVPVHAFGTRTAVTIVEEGEAGPVTGHRHDFEIGGAAFDERRPSRDRVRLICDDAGATLAVHHVDGRLEIITCERGGACEGAMPVAVSAAGFGMARTGGKTLVAWTEDEEGGAIRLRTFAEEASEPRVLAACFEDGDGFCGVPRLAEENGRVLVVAQEGADLRVVESTDGGATFRRMTGVR